MKNKETTPLEYVSKHKDYIDYYIQKVKEDEEAYNQSLAETENLKTRLEWSKGILEHFKLEERERYLQEHRTMVKDLEFQYIIRGGKI